MGVAATIIVLVTFLANEQLALVFTRLTGIAVSPHYTGGEVVRTVQHGTYKTLIHRPVFDGLISDRSTGFIQVVWKGGGPFPPVIEERLDINGDNIVDAIVTFDTKTNTGYVSAKDPSVTGIDRTYRLEDGFAVRIALRNTHEKDRSIARP